MNSLSTPVEEADDHSASPDPQFPSSPPRGTNWKPENAEESASAAGAPAAIRIIPALSDNLFAQGEDGQTYFTRPNRYFGPSSTWKSWTKEERTTALSLDRVRSQDLSIHLFNAFGFKRSAANKGLPARRPKRRKKGKERASSVISTPGDDDDNDENPLPKGRQALLPKSWTAWPLAPDQVPRDELLPSIEEAGEFRAKADPRPSAGLEEWLVATAMKLARERWESRQWEDPPTNDIEAKRVVKTDFGEEEMNSQDGDADDQSQEEDEEEEEEDSGDSSPDAGDVPLFSSQPFNLSDDEDIDDDQVTTVLNTESGDNTGGEDRRPVPLVDDDPARQYFLPSSRHILSKLDDLLLGLHRARYSYAGKPKGKRRGRYSEASDEGTKSEGAVNNHSRSGSRKRRRRSSSANSEFSTASTTSTNYSKRPSRVETLGLRDWSDVMGMASLTGWNPAVVARASERCAKMFDENMLFRTFHEGDAKDVPESCYTENLALDTESSAASPDADAASNLDEERMQVIRTSLPCDSCQASQARCLPADERLGSSRACQRCLELDVECSTIQVAANTGMGRTCPHEGCPRHTIAFRKQYRLQRHLDAVHGPAEPLRRRGKISTYSRSTSAGFSDADLTGEAEEITCPVPGCHRGIKPFSAARGLYNHVRRMHPEVDVTKIKKLQVRRRGERRGRWRDERRTRSKSVSRSMSRRRGGGRDVAMEIEDDEDADEGEGDDDGDGDDDDDVYIESGSEGD